MGLFTNEEEEREKRLAEEARASRSRNDRLKAEAEMRKAELEATRDRSFEIAERAAGISEIQDARRLARSKSGESLVELIQRYEGFDNQAVSSRAIWELILGYTPPTDREGIRDFFKALQVNEDYIKTFVDKYSHGDETSRVFKWWKNLVKKGDAAWDEAFRDYVHEMTDEEQAALDDIRQLKKEKGVEVLKKMMLYYYRFADPMPHGSHRDKDMSPAAQEALTYILRHDPPTEQQALEEYTDYVINNRDDFDKLQERHGLQFKLHSDNTEYTDIGRDLKTYRDTLHSHLLRKIDKAIKAGNYKEVTSGAIGQRNAQNRKTRKIYIGCAVAAVVSILLFAIAVATCE